MPSDSMKPGTTSQSKSLLVSASIFQGGLAMLGIMVGCLFGFHDPSQSLLGLSWTSTIRPALIWGVLGTVPMLVYLWVAHNFPFGPIKHVRQAVEEKLFPLLEGCTIGQMVFLSLLAGLTEEVLFRWCLQGGLIEFLPGSASWIYGLCIASLVFGGLHCINLSYALITTLVGFYLGGLMLWSGTWLAPATAHTLFDFVALFYICRMMPMSNSSNSQTL